MKKPILFILFCVLSFSSFSQDSLLRGNRAIVKHRISFTVNVLPIFINEASLYVDYCYKERHSIGVNAGRIYRNNNFRVNWLSSDQGTNPGTVWDGWVTRINYKYYYSKRRRQFVGVEFLYKSLSYSNQSFTNMYMEQTNTFIRNEKASVYGWDLLYGQRLTPVNWIFNVEFFAGIGYRLRYRNYTTISSETSNYYHQTPKPLGNFSITQKYPFSLVGIKIGINTLQNKQ